jgi:serine/threonine protein phosphatase PrpC
MSAPHQDDTEELPALAPHAGAGRASSFSAAACVEVAGLSHPGKVRPNNEDHFLVGRFGRFLETLHTNVPESEIAARVEETGYGMLVADGVGGSAAGEVASKLAISTLVNLFLQTPDWFLRLDEDSWIQEVIRRTTERYEQVNTELTEQARLNPELRGFATTLTMASSLGRQLLVAHVGDSRAYLFRDGKLQQLTRDHTMAQSMAQVGLISQKQVATHRLRHVLSKAMGDPSRHVDPDVHEHELNDDDCLLLCSDGLTDMVDEKTIAAILASPEPAERICQSLIGEALRAGGNDNVTTIFARYQFN